MNFLIIESFSLPDSWSFGYLSHNFILDMTETGVCKQFNDVPVSLIPAKKCGRVRRACNDEFRNYFWRKLVMAVIDLNWMAVFRN